MTKLYLDSFGRLADPIEENLYENLIREYPEGAVQAFINQWSEQDLERFEDAYYGQYDSVEQLAQEVVEETVESSKWKIPSWLWESIDWEDVWDRTLSYEFIFDNGYVFHRDW